ncbi:MAG TPA: hypothetical protein VE967_04025 [Gemmatimonadaceae bacterium]|nr:hypothetical protein [Gemmatimonadaceae bacterium]
MIDVPGRHLPPDRSAGDESTLGGYMAVHARPAAFDGPDGLPYSVEIMVDETRNAERPFGAYLMFLQWRRVGPAGVDTHVETDYLVFADTAAAARAELGRMSLHDVKDHLDALVRERKGDGGRRWYDAMRDEAGDTE